MSNRTHRFLHGAGRSLTGCEPCMAGERKYRQLQSHDPDTGETPTYTCMGCEEDLGVPHTIELTMDGWSWTAPASNSSTNSSIQLTTAGVHSLGGKWYDCECDFEFRSHDITRLNDTVEAVRINTVLDRLAGYTDCSWVYWDLKSTTIQYHRGQGTTCQPEYTEVSTQTETEFVGQTQLPTNTGNPGGCGFSYQADYNWYEVDVPYGFVLRVDLINATETATGVWEIDTADGTPHWRVYADWWVGRWSAAKAQTELVTPDPPLENVGKATFAGPYGGPTDASDLSNGPGSVPPFRFVPAPTGATYPRGVPISGRQAYWKELDCDDITAESFDVTRSDSTTEQDTRAQWGITAPSTITLAVTS